MSAQHIYDHAPLGALIRFSDGTPRPPERHKRKLDACQDRNAVGHLVEKFAARDESAYPSPANFTLHMADYGGQGAVVLSVHRTFSADSRLTFQIVEQPAPGMVRVVNRRPGSEEMLHIARNEASARVWLSHNSYPDAVLDVVAENDGTSDPGDRRAA